MARRNASWGEAARWCLRVACLATAAWCVPGSATAQGPAAPQASAEAPPPNAPWMDASLDPDRRATLVLAQMTQDEKIQLVHGAGYIGFGATGALARSNGGAGFVVGVPRLGIPDLNMADSTVGVARGAVRSRYSTLLPATIAEASAWDDQLAHENGALIGRELRAQGYNVSLAGGVNLMREPRNGRTFEYRGEDPVLAGALAARFIRGLQEQKVVGDIKHYAFNDQETGRMVGDVRIGVADGRESDLLAFEIGVRDGDPGMVMCSYNKVDGDWACENDYLLNQVLKRDWGFKGFVLSDWGGTHSTVKAIMAGLDQEQPGSTAFGEPLKEAIAAGTVPQSRLDDAVRRILRTMFANGIVDAPPEQQVVDVDAGRAVALRGAEEGIVLLKNDGVLPIARTAKTILVIGSHADIAVLTGGGSGQVDPPGGNAVKDDGGKVDQGSAGIFFRSPVWWPSSPLKALQGEFPDATITFVSGDDPAAAAAAARAADLTVVFGNAPATEGRDLDNIALPNDQDALIGAVAKAARKTAVVLETGGPVSMPWLNDVGAVLAAWYPGAAGGEAIAHLLSGRINPSAKLPISWPDRLSELPNRIVPGTNLPDVPVLGPDGKPSLMRNGKPRMTKPPFRITYPEGADVGYRWFEKKRSKPLFAFGHGLSYTSYTYGGLSVGGDTVTFTVTNTGQRAGDEVAQVYVKVPGRTPRLAGWSRVSLQPGEGRAVTVKFEPLALSTFDQRTNAWTRPRGRYVVKVGGASDTAWLSATFER